MSVHLQHLNFRISLVQLVGKLLTVSVIFADGNKINLQLERAFCFIRQGKSNGVHLSMQKDLWNVNQWGHTVSKMYWGHLGGYCYFVMASSISVFNATLTLPCPAREDAGRLVSSRNA